MGLQAVSLSFKVRITTCRCRGHSGVCVVEKKGVDVGPERRRPEHGPQARTDLGTNFRTPPVSTSSSNDASRPSWRGSTHSTQTFKAGPGPPAIYQPRISNLVTRAGTLEQSAKGNQFWVEGREFTPRESPSSFGPSSVVLCFDRVCACTARDCHRHRERPTGLESQYWLRPSGVP
jgi:hypothetical protein